jgi:membrane protein required for beta-lactamase induction
VAATETVDKRSGDDRGQPAARRIRVQVRRINPWSVLKFSLIFYVCLLVVVLVGLVILYSILSSLGVIDKLEDLLTTIWSPGAGDVATGPNDPVTPFQISAGYLFRTMFLIGAVSTALWAAFTMFLALLYNLIADLVGGVEVTLVERR